MEAYIGLILSVLLQVGVNGTDEGGIVYRKTKKM